MSTGMAGQEMSSYSRWLGTGEDGVAIGRESLGKIHAKLAPTLTPRQAHENMSHR